MLGLRIALPHLIRNVIYFRNFLFWGHSRPQVTETQAASLFIEGDPEEEDSGTGAPEPVPDSEGRPFSSSRPAYGGRWFPGGPGGQGVRPGE